MSAFFRLIPRRTQGFAWLVLVYPPFSAADVPQAIQDGQQIDEPPVGSCGVSEKHYHYYPEQRLSWDEAEEYCNGRHIQGNRGRLAAVMSAEQQALLETAVPPSSSGPVEGGATEFWLGAYYSIRLVLTFLWSAETADGRPDLLRTPLTDEGYQNWINATFTDESWIGFTSPEVYSIHALAVISRVNTENTSDQYKWDVLNKDRQIPFVCEFCGVDRTAFSAEPASMPTAEPTVMPESSDTDTESGALPTVTPPTDESTPSPLYFLFLLLLSPVLIVVGVVVAAVAYYRHRAKQKAVEEEEAEAATAQDKYSDL